jgi:hypothetical protein
MPIQRAENQIWAVYSHLPGGQLVAIHFEDIKKNKKVGENIEEVFITAKEQLEGFRKAPHVALCMKDPATGEKKLTKNEVFVYDGPGASDLWRNKRAGNVVIDYAKKKGIVPIAASKDQKGDDPKTYEYDKRIVAIETRIDEQDKKLDRILEAVGRK